MATVADIQAYIRTNKVPKDVGMRMLSKAEDLDEPKQEFHETPISEGEKTPGFTDTFLPTSLVKSTAKDPAGTIQSLNPAMNLAKGVASSIINAKSGKANLDQIVSPTLESLPLLNALVPTGKAIGAWSGGDKNAPGALLGTLANFALPFVPKGLKAVDTSLGGHLGGMLRGAGEGAMNIQPSGMISAPVHGAIKGLIKGVGENSVPKVLPLAEDIGQGYGRPLPPIADPLEIPDFVRQISKELHNDQNPELLPLAEDTGSTYGRPLPKVAKLEIPGQKVRNLGNKVIADEANKNVLGENRPGIAGSSFDEQLNGLKSKTPRIPMNTAKTSEVPDFIKQISEQMANEAPKANGNVTPIKSPFVAQGSSMNDMLKNIPEKAPDIQPSKTAPMEIENTIQSIKAPEFDNPAQRALDMAQRRLKVASDPKEIQDLNGRVEKLKGMVDRLKSQKEMEIF